MSVAAVDIGTNSVRLLVADIDAAGNVIPRRRLMRITRLGQGVDATHELHHDAIRRTLDVLGAYAEIIGEHDVTGVRVTATSATRDATNRDAFLEAARAELGIEPELITGAEEAGLSFSGATSQLEAPEPFLVVDIGGGSTEFILGTEAPEQLVSIDVGCVRVTERFLHSDPPRPEELSNAVSFVRDELGDVDREVPGAGSAGTLVGLAGTITTMAAVELGLDAYDAEKIHGFRLTRLAAEDVFRTLATEPAAARRHNPGLEPERVDVIVGGALIAVSVMRHWDYEEMLVSEADILDGLARSI